MRVNIIQQFHDTVSKINHGIRLSKADKKALKHAFSYLQDQSAVNDLKLTDMEKIKGDFRRIGHGLYNHQLDLTDDQIERIKTGMSRAEQLLDARLEELNPQEETEQDPIIGLEKALHEGILIFHRLEKGKPVKNEEIESFWIKLEKASDRAGNRIRFDLSVPFLKGIQSSEELIDRFERYLGKI